MLAIAHSKYRIRLSKPFVGVATLQQQYRLSSGVSDWIDEKHERAAPPPPPRGHDAGASAVESGPEAIRRALINALMQKDREVLDLKRTHELSLQRVENTHERLIKAHEEKAVYYEDNVNKEVLTTLEVTEHEFEGVERHRDMAQNVRYLVMAVNILTTIYCMRWMWFYYATDARLPPRARGHASAERVAGAWVGDGQILLKV